MTAAQCRGLSCEIEAKCASHNKMARWLEEIRDMNLIFSC